MAKTALASKAVLVTGCSSGIGYATAERLAKAGATVYATARKPETLVDLKATGCHTLALDVTDESSMRASVDAIEAEHGAVDVLINNAGYSQSGAIESVAIDDVRRQFETNVFGLVRLTQMVLPAMRERRSGTIVKVSSMGANFTFPGGGFYHATKFALNSITDALRFEVQGSGIDVITVEPGIIKTGFGDAAVASLGDVTVGSGPYDTFNASVAQATAEVYESGPLSKLGGPPDSVAKVIEKAVTARRPKIRYRVTASAPALIGQRRLITDRMWDRFLRTQFPQPGKRSLPFFSEPVDCRSIKRSRGVIRVGRPQMR